MAGKFEIDVRGMTTKKLTKLYSDAFPKIVDKALIAAMNTTTRTIRARTIRGISNKSKIKPMKLIRQRTAIWKANRKRLRAGVFFRYGPMPAELLAGKNGVKWNRKKKGVKVKGRFFDGAFAATPRSGKHAGKRKRIYERVSTTGNPKFDLHAKYIKLDSYAGVLETVGNRVVNQKLENDFNKQFMWRMDKAITKAQGIV